MQAGEFIAWVILTVGPLVGAYGLYERFRNPFTQETPSGLYQAVQRHIEGYNANVGDKPNQRPHMESLVALAKEYGARDDKTAYVIVGQWMMKSARR